MFQELRRQQQHLPKGALPNYGRSVESFYARNDAAMSYDVERMQEVKAELSAWIVWYGDWALLKKAKLYVSRSHIDTYRDRAIEKLRSAINNGTFPHLEELGACPGG